MEGGRERNNNEEFLGQSNDGKESLLFILNRIFYDGVHQKKRMLCCSSSCYRYSFIQYCHWNNNIISRNNPLTPILHIRMYTAKTENVLRLYIALFSIFFHFPRYFSKQLLIDITKLLFFSSFISFFFTYLTSFLFKNLNHNSELLIVSRTISSNSLSSIDLVFNNFLKICFDHQSRSRKENKLDVHFVVLLLLLWLPLSPATFGNRMQQ